jgi:hypothetical protein
MATKYPPALSFNEAVLVIKKMFEQHGKETAISLMPQILGISPNSSYLPRKIAALQGFGLIDKTPSDDLAITELGRQIIEPIGDEDARAKLSAFQKNDVLSDLMNKHSNGKLPSADQLQQFLMKNYQIPRETVKHWYEFIIDSFRAIMSTEPLQATEETKNLSMVPSTRSTFQNFELPSGNKFEFLLPNNVTIDDLDFIIGFLELKKKNVKQ